MDKAIETAIEELWAVAVTDGHRILRAQSTVAYAALTAAIDAARAEPLDKAIETAIEAYGRSQHDAGLDGKDPATTVECVLARAALTAAIDAARAGLIDALGRIAGEHPKLPAETMRALALHTLARARGEDGP